jgi:TPR repeat protein
MTLIEDRNPEALYLGAWYSWGDETTEAFDRRYLDWITQSAKQEYPPALFVLAVRYNTGDLVNVDKPKAAQLFKRAAELKHAASQYTHAIDLLYGTNGIEKSEVMGIKYLLESKEAKFQGAFELLGRFYDDDVVRWY